MTDELRYAQFRHRDSQHLAIDAVTKSLTIDTGLGGFTGVLRLADRVHSIPSRDVTFFTVPYYPRSEVVPTDTENVLWKEPQAEKVFTCVRDGIRVSRTAHCSSTTRCGHVRANQPVPAGRSSRIVRSTTRSAG